MKLFKNLPPGKSSIEGTQFGHDTILSVDAAISPFAGHVTAQSTPGLASSG